MKRIVHWTILVHWDDNTNEYLNDIPQYVADEVDQYLTDLEEERHDNS